MIASAGTILDFRAIEASLEYFRKRDSAKWESELGLFHFSTVPKVLPHGTITTCSFVVIFAAHPLPVLRAEVLMFAGPIERKRPLVSQK
jgi:hypothetical protein